MDSSGACAVHAGRLLCEAPKRENTGAAEEYYGEGSRWDSWTWFGSKAVPVRRWLWGGTAPCVRGSGLRVRRGTRAFLSSYQVQFRCSAMSYVLGARVAGLVHGAFNTLTLCGSYSDRTPGKVIKKFRRQPQVNGPRTPLSSNPRVHGRHTGTRRDSLSGLSARREGGVVSCNYGGFVSGMCVTPGCVDR